MELKTFVETLTCIVVIFRYFLVLNIDAMGVYVRKQENYERLQQLLVVTVPLEM